MSDLVFPTIPGVSIEREKSPIWNSIVQRSASGRSVGLSTQVYPNWRYKLKFEFLRAGMESELQSVVGLFNRMHGRADTFLFLDDDDKTAFKQLAGVGDGVKKVFDLYRTFGTFVEPVHAILSEPLMYVNDVPKYGHARTNLFWRSEELNATYWTKTGVTVTANNALSPLGGLTADSVVEAAVAGAHNISSSNYDFEAGKWYTFSFHVAPLSVGSKRYVEMILPSIAFGGSANAIFDTVTGAIMRYDALVRPVSAIAGPNGHWRISISAYATTTVAGYVTARLNTDGTTSWQTYTGDGVSGINGWGVMLEESDEPTTYVASVGDASGVASADFTWTTNAIITFAVAPPAAAPVAWSGEYYWRCRFDDDDISMDRFLWQLWKADSVAFTTEKK